MREPECSEGSGTAAVALHLATPVLYGIVASRRGRDGENDASGRDTCGDVGYGM